MEITLIGDVRVEPRLIFSSGLFGSQDIIGLANRVMFFKDCDHHTGLDLVDVVAPYYHHDLREILVNGNSVSATLTLVLTKDRFSSDLKLGSVTMKSRPHIYTIDYTEVRRSPFIFNASDDLAALRSYACLLNFDLSTMHLKTAQGLGVSKLSRFYSESSSYVPIFPIEGDNYTKSLENLNISINDLIR